MRGVSSRDRSWGANGRADSRASGSGLLSLEWFQSQAEKHAAATPLNYFAGNFIKIHRTHRMSPAMAAGVADRLGDVADLVALWESFERRAERAA